MVTYHERECHHRTAAPPAQAASTPMLARSDSLSALAPNKLFWLLSLGSASSLSFSYTLRWQVPRKSTSRAQRGQWEQREWKQTGDNTHLEGAPETQHCRRHRMLLPEPPVWGKNKQSGLLNEIVPFVDGDNHLLRHSKGQTQYICRQDSTSVAPSCCSLSQEEDQQGDCSESLTLSNRVAQLNRHVNQPANLRPV